MRDGDHGILKDRACDLAVCGGRPAFAEPLCVGRPNVGDRRRLHERIDDLLDRRVLSNDGPLVREFERQVAAVAGVAHCVAVCNASMGLGLAARALGMAGEVIVPAFTFVATAHALAWHGLTPVFCDVDLATHNLDPRCVARLVTSRTTGVVGVHLWGRPCEVEGLSAVARRHGLPLLFDAAHAFACSHGGRMVGGFGDAEVFSFHATKFVNTFEGGAVVTNRADVADRVRVMRNYGTAGGGGTDDPSELGINAKMSEAAAAMGLTCLESLDKFRGVNYGHYRRYRHHLNDLPGVRFGTYDDDQSCNYQYVFAEVDPARAGLTRDDLLRVLAAENVVARRYFHPGCHRAGPYAGGTGARSADLPHTERLAGSVLTLPTGTAVTAFQVEVVCALIRTAVCHAGEVRAALAATAPGDAACARDG